ncbi:hypothetical protein H5410_046180 [Solanum commersonii]|uniref:Uncharacterized protein n=1 Tax=Solanum commersonii TaxID=4109 RepID=A0A9J5XDG2_SOLCO|nr:hypothetical protein H5410_046180 [Solanum commersonii]
MGWGASHVWRKIIIRDELEHNIWWHIKAGSPSFWFNNLIRMGDLYSFGSATTSEEELEVKEFITEVVDGQYPKKLHSEISMEDDENKAGD